MKIFLPDYVKFTLNKLSAAGFDAWIVGGSVRDSIMGKSPEDYDIATSARPEQVIELFEKTIPTGIKHGTITVLTDKQPVEITTYRTENGYTDSRHPGSVNFVSNIKDDLSRRDFTVNAIAYNEEKGIFDPFDGITDINRKILRTVGHAPSRFDEDALRILRLFRFSSQLGFNIEEKALNAAIEFSNKLENISPERIREEFFKALCAKNPFVLNKLLKTHSLSFVGLNNKCTVPENISLIPQNAILRFSYFCFKNRLNAMEICKYLKTSKAFLNECECICSLMNKPAPKTKQEVKRALSKIDLKVFEKYSALYESLNNTNYLSNFISEILNNNEPYRIDMLKITGEDLLSLGFKGRSIGKALEFLLKEVIKDPQKNTFEQLKSLL